VRGIEVLRQRNFRSLFGAQAVSVLGDRMVAVALAFAVLGLGGSASAVGLVLAARTFALVAALLAGGVVADRTSRRAVMVTADLSRLASQGVLAALVIGGAPPLWLVAVLSALTGAATGFFNPASTGLLPAIVAPRLVQQANGLRVTAMSAGEIVGPAVAGVLVAAVGPGWAIGVDAATFAVSAVLLSGLHLPQRAERPAAASFLADLREGWDAFRSRTWLWTVVVSAGLGNLVWGAWSSLGPVVAKAHLGGAGPWGGVLAAMGVGALLGGLLAIRFDPGRPLLLFVALGALFSLPLALLAIPAPAALIGAGALFAGATMMLGNSVWESTLQRRIPTESLSRVSAYDWFGSFAFQPLGYAMWGPLSTLIGIPAALWIAAGGWLAVTAVLLSVRDIRTLRHP
jgi:predicted MFS family arabinose efflux permease